MEEPVEEPKDPETEKLEREIDELFYDPKDARFWKSEGLKHRYLYWVRATTSRGLDEPPFEELSVAAPAGDEGKLALAESRHQLYRLLAAGFAEPTEELSVAVVSGAFKAELEAALDAWEGWPRPELLQEGLDDLTEAAKMDAAEAHDLLLTEYTRMIYDSFMPFVAPYESVYHGERQVIGERYDSVRAAYAEVGLGVEGTELVDHAMHECEFVSWLAGEEAAARQAGDTARAADMSARLITFLDRHLLTWGTKLGADIATIARQPFYLGICKVAGAIFSAERALLGKP